MTTVVEEKDAYRRGFDRFHEATTGAPDWLRARRASAFERFARVLRQRRQNASGFTKVFQRLAGLEAKIKQYAEGEHFISVVEDHGGAALLDRAWAEPANVPSINEIREPELWIARVGADAAV